MLIGLASILSGAIGLAIILIGARFLLAPQIAATGYGIPVGPPGAGTSASSPYPWFHVKGVRDIVSGIFIFILLIDRTPHLLGIFMIAASITPAGDTMIVLRNGGTRGAAFGIHGATAAVVVATGAALLVA